MYRQTDSRYGLSIEEGTGGVPADGRFYVLDQGVVHRSYRSFNAARRKYEQLRAERSEPPAAPSEGGAA